MVAHAQSQVDRDPRNHPYRDLRVFASEVLNLNIHNERFNGERRTFHIFAQNEAIDQAFTVDLDKSLRFEKGFRIG